jgi:hypothetical protein
MRLSCRTVRPFVSGRRTRPGRPHWLPRRTGLIQATRLGVSRPMRWSFLLSLGLLFVLSAQQPVARGMGSRLSLPCGPSSPSGTQSEEEAGPEVELLSQVAGMGERWRLQPSSGDTSRPSVRSPRPSLRMRCPAVAPREAGARWRVALLPRRQPPEDEPSRA